jgi:hypothetical protein
VKTKSGKTKMRNNFDRSSVYSVHSIMLRGNKCAKSHVGFFLNSFLGMAGAGDQSLFLHVCVIQSFFLIPTDIVLLLSCRIWILFD